MKKKLIIITTIISFIAVVSSGFCAFLFMQAATQEKQYTQTGTIIVDAEFTEIGNVSINALPDGFEGHKIIFGSGDAVDQTTSNKGIYFTPEISFSYSGYALSVDDITTLNSKYNFSYYLSFESINSKLFNGNNPYAYFADIEGQSYEKRIPFELEENSFTTIKAITPEFYYLPNMKPFNEADYLKLQENVGHDLNHANNVSYNIKIHIVAEVKW